MESLPAEILEKIFSYLDLKSLELLVPTCQRWSDIIALRFYQPALAAQSAAVRRQLAAGGWQAAGKNSPALIRRLYRKVFHELPRRWRGVEGGHLSSVGPEIILGEYE
jgi:F-box-like